VFRYVLEGLTEQELLDIDRRERVANTSVTTYETRAGELHLVRFNGIDHLAAEGETVTEQRAATEEPHATEQS
jgi:hypothetical protein